MATGRRFATGLLMLLGAAAGVFLVLGRKGSSTRGRAAALAGNPTSRVFHRMGCRMYHHHPGDPEFFDREAAVLAGYRPCGVCKP